MKEYLESFVSGIAGGAVSFFVCFGCQAVPGVEPGTAVNAVEAAICAEEAMKANPRITLEEAVDMFCTGAQLLPFKDAARAARDVRDSERQGD